MTEQAESIAQLLAPLRDALYQELCAQIAAQPDAAEIVRRALELGTTNCTEIGHVLHMGLHYGAPCAGLLRCGHCGAVGWRPDLTDSEGEYTLRPGAHDWLCWECWRAENHERELQSCRRYKL